MMTILSLLPILSLLLCLIVIKLSVAKSAAISLALALVIALVFFGLGATGLTIAVGKALVVALFVSLIVWCALMLYHLVSDFKAIDVINKNITIFVEDKFVAFVLLAWLFTGLLQGMAGFGVPAVIVAPILIALGFNPVKSLAAALLGHSWAVTFGSMGAAFFVISGITGNSPESLGVPMWIFNTIAHVMTGLGVCWLYDGLKGIKKGLAYIFPVSIVMAVVQYFTIISGLYALASINPALTGLVTMFVLYKLRSRSETKPKLYKGDLTLVQSLLPYATILVVSILFQFLPTDLRNNVAVSFRFPEFVTSLGHVVPAETAYMPIRLFGHPSVILLLASIVAIVVYKRAGIWSSDVFRGAVVSYANEVKEALLGVSHQILETVGAVSSQTACAMALGALSTLGVDMAVSVTGIAGPQGGSREKPVGTVWFARACRGDTIEALKAEMHLFCGDREGVRSQATAQALRLFIEGLSAE